MDKTANRYSRLRINFTTSLPLDVIDDLKTVAVKKGEKITTIVEQAVKEYFVNHDVFNNETTEMS